MYFCLGCLLTKHLVPYPGLRPEDSEHRAPSLAQKRLPLAYHSEPKGFTALGKSSGQEEEMASQLLPA